MATQRLYSLTAQADYCATMGHRWRAGCVFQMQRSGRQWTGKTEEVPAEIDRKLLKEMIWF